MFEIPDAKRVKRSELIQGDISPQSLSRSTSPVAADDQEEPTPNKVDYGFEYDFITPGAQSAQPSQTEAAHEPSNEDNNEDQEFDFRLFTTAPKHPSQPIRLSATPPPTDPTKAPSLEEANFIRPHRPDSYYFTSALPAEFTQTLKSQYATVALSTADMLSLAMSTKWPGTSLPWRCIHVQLTKPINPSQGRDHKSATKPFDSTTDSRRTRPSKKRRILLRKRLALRANLAAQAGHDEEAEREKRTRRNREKKVKRKEREKRKKLESEDQPQSTGTKSQVIANEDEDHSMTDDKDVGVQNASVKSATVTATIDELPGTSTAKEGQPSEAVSEATSADRPPKVTPAAAPPTARRAAPTSRAPTSRAPTARAAGS
ncbi:hypothetical protein LTR10_012678 [Elasticomyces elasticus]|uniref:BZIP domain-containing protein n=1 Tax=Exophiala sideris TaxID=1016849 RepID=A0ABR0JR95_9EURO|nr:hypothetical protein LTR10_012678 [Elasticomyces elasticus]KAK5034556.1 hypothetical protein LTR13_006211 [Exophiala sideris]KAK5040122.1 hypothetical protein LTS07_000619 [Exophiala sideris]KAK5068500.1 hypothetical protein LTR69_000620 [Exophiala sideris]KAK5187803.1 hypothetical protein LTR44_000621 [Eurotiomycetes sp. CCFEE 6388]